MGARRQRDAARDAVVRRRLPALLVLVSTMPLPGLRAATGGPDGAGTTWADVNSGCPVEADSLVLANEGSFVAGSGTEFFIGPLDLGFAFPFHGRFVSECWLHSAGLIFLQPPPADALSVNQPIPFPGDGAAGFIAPYWTHFDFALTPHCWWESHVPEGYFKISYSMIPQDSFVWSPVEFEVYLYRSGDIRIEYVNPSDGLAATIGTEAPSETTGLQMRHDASYTNGMTFGTPTPFSICITPAPTGFVCTGAGTIDCGAAQAGTLPGGVPTNATAYNCAAGTWDAVEIVQEIVIPVLSDVSLTLTDTDGRDMAIFLLSRCAVSACLAGGGTSVEALAVMAGTYLVVVDAATAADEGSFMLAVLCTPTAMPIACGDTMVDDTTGRPNHVQDEACGPPLDWTGSDAVFEVDFTPPGHLAATVASATGHGVFIFDASRPLIRENCLVGGVDGAVFYDPPAGRYLILVDGPAGSEGPFTLSLDCAPQISCGTAVGTIACMDAVSGTTIGRDDFVDFYRCSGIPHDGPEAVHVFDAPTRQTVSFVLETSDPRLDLFLLDACDEASCVAFGDSEMSVNLSPGRYYLVVDGSDEAAADYTLRSFCGSGLVPTTVSLAGNEGECFDEHKIGWLTPELALADVVFAIDLTESMGGEVAALRDNMQSIIDNLQGFIADVAYGLISYKDYPRSASVSTPCVYSGAYGQIGDYPYLLMEPVTTDRVAIQSAVDGMVVGGGGDGPEAFNRMLHEAANDAALGWRPGARRILVNFGDDMPHDCDVLRCLGDSAPARLGVDLGRDGVPNTADDLETLEVVQGLVDANIVLIHFDSSGGGSVGAWSYADVWNCWAQATGGVADGLNADGSVPRNIGGIGCDPATRTDCLAELVADRILAHGSACADLRLEAQPGYEAWLVDPGAVHPNVRLPAVKTFDIRFCIPVGTPPGPYDFEVRLLCGGELVATQQVHVDVMDCVGSIGSEPADATICEGESVDLDASGLTTVGCSGSTEYEWRDETGAIVGTTAAITVSPAAQTTYTVEARCSTSPPCTTTADALVSVELPPVFELVAVADPEPCNLGLEVTWDPAQFRDATGTGTYAVYRSEIDCADALTRPPVALGIPDLRWVDATTAIGPSYWYVVQAEDARTVTACTPGPANGGAVNENVVCAGPIAESPDASTPSGPWWTLRILHDADVVTLSWAGSRPLVAGEHFHLLKGHDETSFTMINPEGQLATGWTEVDATRPLQFFDVRIANPCEIESLDDEPAGWDVPR